MSLLLLFLLLYQCLSFPPLHPHFLPSFSSLSPLLSLIFSPPPLLLFSLPLLPSSVRVWDVHMGKLKHTLTGHTEEVECLRVCGEMALSGSWDHSLRVWDTTSGLCRHTLLRHTEGEHPVYATFHFSLYTSSIYVIHWDSSLYLVYRVEHKVSRSYCVYVLNFIFLGKAFSV